MELVLQELFITAFVALVFSFCIAKLVSIATTTRGHTKRELGFEKSTDAVRRRDGVVEETTKFDGGLRVQSRTKSRRKVRFADESVQKVDKFEAVEEERCLSVDAADRIEVLGVSVGSTEGQSSSSAEIVGGWSEVVGINVDDSDGLVVKEEGSEGKKEEEIETETVVVNEGNEMADVAIEEDLVDELKRGRGVDKLEELCCSDEFEEKLCDSVLIGDSRELAREAADIGGVGVGVIMQEGVLGNLDGLVVEKEGGEGKEADDVETITSIKAEEKLGDLDGLVCKEGSEGKEADDVERDIKEDGAVANLDELGVKKGCGRKEVDDVASAINKGNDEEDVGDIETRCEGVKGDDIGNENKEEGLVTDLDGLVEDEGGKEVDGVESDTKEGNPMANLVFEGKIMENAEADADVGEVENVINEGNEIDVLVFKEKIVENEDAGCKIDIGSVIDDIVVAQDAKVSDVESGSEGELNKGDVKEDEPVGDEEDDWEGIERSELDEVFSAAAKYVASGGKDERLSNMGSDVQMQFYGLHKVAMEGPCHERQPMAIKISSRAKWNAWQRMGSMDPEVAMEQYIALLSDKVPGWMEGKSSGDDNADSLESGILAAPYRDISIDSYDQHHPTKKRELEDYGADGGI